MTPTQREAALRLADDMDTPISVWADHVAHLLRDLAAEPVQEPVAWEYWNPSDTTFSGQDTFLKKAVSYFTDDTRRGYAAQGYMFRPLFYARPPQQRKPLTDKEIIELPAWDDYMGGCITLLDFARAIEKAHDITGEQK